MNDALQVIREWWVMVAATVATVAWLVRLEARGLQNSAKAADNAKAVVKESAERKEELIALELRLEKQRQEDMALRREDREDTKQILREMQGDIKLLLQRAAK